MNKTSMSKIVVDQEIELDRSEHESNEHACSHDENPKPKQSLSDSNILLKEGSLELEECKKYAINGELSSLKMNGTSPCVYNKLNALGENNLVNASLEANNSNKDSTDGTIGQQDVFELESKISEEIQDKSQLDVKDQSMEVTSSFENDECFSEEEVYSEVDEILGSDEEFEGDEDEEDLHQINNACEKTSDPIAIMVEDEMPTLTSENATAESLNKVECLDDPMPLEEVSKRILRDSDEGKEGNTAGAVVEASSEDNSLHFAVNNKMVVGSANVSTQQHLHSSDDLQSSFSLEPIKDGGEGSHIKDKEMLEEKLPEHNDQETELLVLDEVNPSNIDEDMDVPSETLSSGSEANKLCNKSLISENSAQASDAQMEVSNEDSVAADITEKSEGDKLNSLLLSQNTTSVQGRNERIDVLDNTEMPDGFVSERLDKKESHTSELFGDEIDSLVEEFKEAECSSVDDKICPTESQGKLQCIDDDFDLVIEEFKAASSDDDCLIVEDTDNVITIKDDPVPNATKSTRFVEMGANTLVEVSNAKSVKPKNKDSPCENSSSLMNRREKLDDPIHKPTGIVEQASHFHKETESLSKSAETCVLNEKNSTQAGKELLLNSNLTSEVSGEKLLTNDVEENIDEIVNCVIENLLNVVCPGSMDCSTNFIKLISMQGKKGNESLNVNCKTIPSFHESSNKSDLKTITDEDFHSLKAIESSSIHTNSSDKGSIKEESKKRTFDKVELDSPDFISKRLKEDQIYHDVPVKDDLSMEKKIKENISKLLPQKSSCKFITTTKILDRIAMGIISMSLRDTQPKNHNLSKQYVEDAKKMFKSLDEDFQYYENKIGGFGAAQDEKFQMKKFNHQAPPTVNSTSTTTRPLVPLQQSPPVRRIAPSAIVTNTSPRPSQINPKPRFTPVSPNVTMAGNPLANMMTAASTNRSPVPRPNAVLTRAPIPNNSSTIDLTGEGAMNRRTLASSTATSASVPTTVVSNVNLPGQKNVLVPITNLPVYQMLPTTQSIPHLSGSTGVQVSRHAIMQPARQSLLQAIRPGLLPSTLRPGTRMYIMNSNSASNIGGQPGVTMVPGSNPRSVQTFVVRMTNAASVPSLSTNVNSLPRMGIPLQSIGSSNTPTTSTSSVVLVPRAVRHPAPFPPSPVYPRNPSIKLLPPKPSLKGSIAPQPGIILSWSLNLQPFHAEITSYQLFAYQELKGPITSSLWKKVGNVNALPLPMACTLTQFINGNRYYFGVRAVDIHNRCGPYSDPVSVFYTNQGSSNSQTPTTK